MSLARLRWTLLVFVLAVPVLHALDLADLENAKERAGVIDKVRALLADKSPSVRLAVFEQVMKGKDPVLRSMALETALNSDDKRLKTAALRQLIRDRENILVEPVQPVNPTQAQAYLYQWWRGLVIYKLKIDDATDEITGAFKTAGIGGNSLEGQLTRGGWQLRMSYGNFSCVMALKEISGVEITGSLDCAIIGRGQSDENAGAKAASLPIRIRLS